MPVVDGGDGEVQAESGGRDEAIRKIDFVRKMEVLKKIQGVRPIFHGWIFDTKRSEESPETKQFAGIVRSDDHFGKGEGMDYRDFRHQVIADVIKGIAVIVGSIDHDGRIEQ